MIYPTLPVGNSSRQMVDEFRGYNHNLRIGDGEFYEMENMSSDCYPVLSPRKPRRVVDQSTAPNGMFYVPGCGLFVADGNFLFLQDDSGAVKTIFSDLEDCRKRFAMMGAYLIVTPDMRWIDTTDPEAAHTMGERWEVTSGSIKIELCDIDGQVYENVTASTEAPTSPGNLELWLDTSVSGYGLKQYSAVSAEWVSVATTYLKISGLGDHYFETGDGVKISGIDTSKNMRLYDVEGTHVIQRSGHGDIVIIGILDAAFTQECTAEAPVILEREVPKLDFVVEAGNRLWGVIKGKNEIYASKLGDFKNWNVFQGIATDSWVGNVGTPGDFTGAINHGGYPIFYKEDVKHKVWPSSSGAHQITTANCAGVQSGSGDSLAIVGGVLFYKSRDSICMDDGSGPVDIGDVFGKASYSEAVAVAHRNKYYVCMTDDDRQRHLFVYDAKLGLWHCEDNWEFGAFASTGESLYAGTVEGKYHGYLYDLDPESRLGEPENYPVKWMVQTGDLGLSTPDRKYISRLTIRMALNIGSEVSFYVQYDYDGIWVKLGTVYGSNLRTFSIPVRPRRCDNLRLKICGTGYAKIFSITKTIEEGSELR